MQPTTQKQVSYRKKRYLVYVIAAAVLLSFPFITIDDTHLFLLSFEHGELHLLGTRFNMQELYLMPFLLILLFVGIFFLTTLAGRLWCGWACPQTIFRVIYRDLLQTTIFGLRKKISNKQQPMRLESFIDKLKATLAFVIIAFLCLVAAANLMWFFVPPEDFFSYIMNPLDHPVLMVFWLGFGIFFIFDITFIQENFCIYICPYCRVQSVLYDNDTLMPTYNYNRGGFVYDKHGTKATQKLKFIDPNAECIECEQCVKVCPTHIDIRKGMQLECINCLECVDACTGVMGKLNKPSLVSWTSPTAMEHSQKVQYFRFKTIAYIVVLSVVFVALLVISTKKEGMLLNINTTSELYKIRTQEVVDNTFRAVFHNTDSVDHEFSVEIVSPNKDFDIASRLEIIKPKEPFVVKAGQKITQMITIRARENLSRNDRGDSIYPIVLHSFAIDDKDRIFANRKTNFTYPSQETIQTYLQKHQEITK
ncbi:cytochrome c oxidase accessory protein CcoG [Helicobacter equorum]|uniref:cytochrome c oxidase accessory protein CcoG n=1 Tax=Helicobacter equorum TaxID=361872 RepID=UPI000CF0A477|nr:cytochrome c oxidase accessory protein CcoG [Helicobacter equorum]